LLESLLKILIRAKIRYKLVSMKKTFRSPARPTGKFSAKPAAGRPSSSSRSAPPASKKAGAASVRPQVPSAHRGGRSANAGRGHRPEDTFKAGGPNWPREWRAVIGQHAIMEVLKIRPKSIQQAWLKQGWEASADLKELYTEMKSRGLKVDNVPVSFLDKISVSHQGAAVFSNQTPEVNFAELARLEKSIALVLDGIEDPQNLGAIMRTSWLMGVAGLIIPEDRAVGLTATAHKVACGGVEHVPVERTTNFSNPIEELKKNGYWVFGLSHEGERSLFDLEIPDKVVWCIGSEEKGLRVTTERLCDELIRIPQISAAASYNASVATAIALTETHRQQSLKKLSN
jgi:23S rRNA (guanosine2251-2'-O)-methyltransferase